jgi:signal transduction histidine kinase
MSLRDTPTTPTWTRLGPVVRPPEVSRDQGRPADRAWRLWEVLRSFDRRYATGVDAVIAVGLFVLCTGFFVPAHTGLTGLGFSAGLTLPLMFRRRAPIIVFSILALVALAQWAVTRPLFADAALLVALYTVAADAEWVQVFFATAVLEIGVAMATVQWAPVGGDFKSWVFLTGMVFAALFAGVVVRALRNQLEWLSERADRLEVERDQQASLAAAAERSRIAREMHDVVSHNIQVMVTLADAAAIAGPTDPERAREAMSDVSGTGRQALIDMRRMLGLLREGDLPRPAGVRQLDGAGTGGHSLQPQPGLDELPALVERVRSTGLNVSLERRGNPFELSQAAELTLYRIVQEALTNALKHAASPQSVQVALQFDDPEVSVQVTDDGRLAGNDAPEEFGGEGGHGVSGMAERAAAFGGTLTAGPHGGGGWRVEATLRSGRPTGRA